MPETTWPEGVIARYLTVGGATVDVAHKLNVFTPPEPVATLATCTGCGADDTTSHYRNVWHGSLDHGAFGEEHDQAARRWAQSHAETCRAMSKPTA
ncbi:hypothetical protein [Streptomyces sp. NPDC046161]|uniref:hypothetical protein n=1 Tax=Streptomyces sp. NPDC046161 TaxID=3155132 RepID=UPI0033F4B054